MKLSELRTALANGNIHLTQGSNIAALTNNTEVVSIHADLTRGQELFAETISTGRDGNGKQTFGIAIQSRMPHTNPNDSE